MHTCDTAHPWWIWSAFKYRELQMHQLLQTELTVTIVTTGVSILTRNDVLRIVNVFVFGPDRSVTSCPGAHLWPLTWESAPMWCTFSSNCLHRTWRTCSSTRTSELEAERACPPRTGRATRTLFPKPPLQPRTLLTLHPQSKLVLRRQELPLTRQLPPLLLLWAAIPPHLHISPALPAPHTQLLTGFQPQLCRLGVHIPALLDRQPHRSVQLLPQAPFLDPGAQCQPQPSERSAFYIQLSIHNHNIFFLALEFPWLITIIKWDAFVK